MLASSEQHRLITRNKLFIERKCNLKVLFNLLDMFNIKSLSVVASSLTDFTEVGWRDDQRKELCKVADGLVTTTYHHYTFGKVLNFMFQLKGTWLCAVCYHQDIYRHISCFTFDES